MSIKGQKNGVFCELRYLSFFKRRIGGTLSICTEASPERDDHAICRYTSEREEIYVIHTAGRRGILCLAKHQEGQTERIPPARRQRLRMLYMNGQERNIHFRTNFPELANRIPQKHIATFLGLTPEFFNTIHARVLRLPG